MLPMLATMAKPSAGKIFVTSLGGGNASYAVLFGSLFVGLGAGMAFGPRIARELSRRRLFGLAILVVYFRNRGTIEVEDINLMKG